MGSVGGRALRRRFGRADLPYGVVKPTCRIEGRTREVVPAAWRNRLRMDQRTKAGRTASHPSRRSILFRHGPAIACETAGPVRICIDLFWGTLNPGKGHRSAFARLDEIVEQRIEPNLLRMYWAHITLEQLSSWIHEGRTEAVALFQRFGEYPLNF